MKRREALKRLIFHIEVLLRGTQTHNKNTMTENAQLWNMLWSWTLLLMWVLAPHVHSKCWFHWAFCGLCEGSAELHYGRCSLQGFEVLIYFYFIVRPLVSEFQSVCLFKSVALKGLHTLQFHEVKVSEGASGDPPAELLFMFSFIWDKSFWFQGISISRQLPVCCQHAWTWTMLKTLERCRSSRNHS